MRRGQIWIGSGGVYARKPRPQLILQDDLYASRASVIVLPFTSVLSDAPLVRVRVAATPASGISQASDVQLDKITAIRRSSLTEQVGAVDQDVLRTIERNLLLILGFGR